MFLEDLKQEERQQLEGLLIQTGSTNKEEALVAQKAFAAAITTPLRQGILIGDNIGNIFQREVFNPNARVEYPIDFYRPDNAYEFTAYVIPNQGKIPQRQIEGDYLTVPTYDIGAGIDWLLRYAREARYNIVGRALEVLEAGFTQKLNNDGWHTILAAGFDRNIVVSDANAAPGQFTKRLVSLMKLVTRRNAGGNASSVNRGRLTHIFLSPEAMEDMRSWDFAEVDDVTRRELYLADDNAAADVFGIKLVVLDELGEGQEYQNYYQQIIALGAANNGMAAGDLEIVIGMDLSNQDSFVMPIREELQVFEDETLHRERRQGYYAWMSAGFAVLNNQRVILGSL
jgi:hypothetical protein